MLRRILLSKATMVIGFVVCCILVAATISYFVQGAR
jgi:hypothetical protein